MMEWFVIYNNEHLGPFSEAVLHQLYKEGDVSDDTQVWKEGMDESISYKDQFLLQKEQLDFKPLSEVSDQVSEVNWDVEEDKDDDVPPPLPPGITSSAVEEQVAIDEVEQPVELDEVETSVVNKEIVEEYIDLPSFEEEVDTSLEDEEEINSEVLEDKEIVQRAKNISKDSNKSKFFLFAGVFLFILLIVPGYFVVKNIYLSFSRPAMMGVLDYARLKEVSQDPSFSNKFAIALGQERARIWLATNIPYEGEVVLKLKSIKEKTLTNTEVEAMAKGYLKGKIVEFSNWTFTKGSKLVDGYYHVEAHTTKNLIVPIVLQYLPQRKKQFRFFDEMLISQLTAEEFKEALGKTKKEQTRNDLEFWAELKQKYKTIKMITLQIKTEMERAFDSSNVMWIEELKKFESKYKREFGAFFTNFVIQNDQSYTKLKDKNFSNKIEIISNYNRLSSLAKDIGRVSMDVFHEMESFDGIDNARKEIIRKRASQKLGKIIQTCDQKIQMIQTN